MAKSTSKGAPSASIASRLPYKTASGRAAAFPSSVSKAPKNVVASVGGAKNGKGGK
jgi:hypothetical protein